VDLLDIYNGNKPQWPDGKSIIPNLMYRDDSVNAILTNQIPGFSCVLDEALRKNYWKVHYNDFFMADAIATKEGSIGFSDASFVCLSQGKMKPLKLDGVAPTVENILSGAYRMERGLYFVYRDPLDARAAAFLDFVFSPEGRQLIQAAQAIPVARDKMDNK
jgi:phosphate transport system substrate-binding protein